MDADQSYTVTEFCEAERISRSLLYRAWREGWGPEFYNIASHRRISPEARREWRERLKARSDS